MDGPRACQPEEDTEIVDLINSLFREGTGQNVRTDYPLVYDPSMFSNRRIIKLDGKVVAHVPAIPHTVISKGDTFTIAMISATLTHPDYRRRGLATECLKDCIRIMGDCSWPVSVLWTEERTFPFYQNSGWEAVASQGKVYKVHNNEAHLFRNGKFEAIQYCSTNPQHISAVQSLHDNEVSRIGRSSKQHNALFSLPLMGTLIASIGNKMSAYLTYSHSMNKPGLVEAGGNILGIESLIRHVLDNNFFDNDTQVIVPLTQTGLGNVMETAKPGTAHPVEQASGVGFQMHRINSFKQFFLGIQRHLDEKAIGLKGEVCLVCSDSGETVSLQIQNGNVLVSSNPIHNKIILTRRELTQLIFGSHHKLPQVSVGPSNRKILDRLFPYYFPVWELDHC